MFFNKGVDYDQRRINPHKMLKRDLVFLYVTRCKEHGIPYAQHPACYFKDLDKGLIKPEWEEKIAMFDIEANKEFANWGYLVAYALKPLDGKPILRKINPKGMHNEGDWDKHMMIQLCKDLRKFDRIVVYWGKDMRWDVPWVRTRTLYWKSQAINRKDYEEAEKLNFPEYMEMFVYDLFDPVKSKLKMSKKGLGYVSRYFGIPAKETWLDSNCMNCSMKGEKWAIDRIGKHCVEDVETTEGLYKILHPFTRQGRTSI